MIVSRSAGENHKKSHSVFELLKSDRIREGNADRLTSRFRNVSFPVLGGVLRFLKKIVVDVPILLNLDFAGGIHDYSEMQRVRQLSRLLGRGWKLNDRGLRPL